MLRNFAVRLTCPLDERDTWITLSNREESFEQVLQQTWDFKCREHGPQRGLPKEILEMAPPDDFQPQKKSAASPAAPFRSTTVKRTPRSSPRISLRVPVTIYGSADKGSTFREETQTLLVNSSGGLVTMQNNINLGDAVFMVHKVNHQEQPVRVAYLHRSSDREWHVGLAFRRPMLNFWLKNRRSPRVPKSLRVVIKGKDAQGRRFAQSVYTVDLSREGARLEGVGFLATPGQTIQVSRHWRKANFRVVWTGQVGTAEANQIGILGLQPGKNIWPIKFPDHHDGSAAQNEIPSKK